jgi:uncharacterized Zn-binding protein involved in type VI secretion
VPSVAIHPPKTPVHEGSHTIAKATIPNICKMPGPPAPFVPAPLPNIAKSELSPKDYSTTVKIEGNAVAIRGSTFESIGDMASKGTGGGLISANCHGPAKFIAPGSMSVKIEGKNVHLLGDSMLNNLGPSGSPPNTGATMMGADHSDLSVQERCEKVKEDARRRADEELEKNKTRTGDDKVSKVSVVRTFSGATTSGVNSGGNNASVEALARSFRPNEFNCKCAELNCLTNADTRAIYVQSGHAVMVTMNVGGPKHGTKEDACSVCQQVLLALGITEC